LSGGEKARLSLLKLMLSGANVLIMDEPTNHLDIASKEVFEEALLEFPGTMILVSHDRYFLNRVPTRIIELGEEGTINYLGGYDYYMEKKQSLGSGKSYLEDLGKTVSGSLKENSNDSIASNIGVVDISNSESGENSVLSPMETRRRVKEEQRQQKRLEKERKRLEEAIAETEGKIAWIENEMCKEEVYKDYKIAAKYQNDLDSLKRSLSEIYESWIALSD
jgi:ATP-binding cassette subfamily F protein 3